jgi:predicted nucleic acid-binding Zn ribbon protein
MLSNLKDLVPQLVTRLGLHVRRDADKINEAWNEAVGEPYMAVTRVRRITRGTLEIAVKHNAFAQELSFRKNELLAAMQSSVPDEQITRIKFVTG